MHRSTARESPRLAVHLCGLAVMTLAGCYLAHERAGDAGRAPASDAARDGAGDDAGLDGRAPDAGCVCPTGFECSTGVCRTNPALEFSATMNPSAAWSYGWSTTRGGPFNLFVHSFPRVLLTSGSLDCWGRAGESDATPGLMHNAGTVPAVYSDTTWPAGGLVAHPGPAGENAVLRWTAPAAGSYRVDVTFRGITTTGTTSGVAVLHGTDTLFTAELNASGSGNEATFGSTFDAVVGTTLDFAIGFGANGNYYSDSTEIDAVITPVGG